MSKQDRQGVRTPADIERKYNLGQLNDFRGQSQKQDLALTEIIQTVNQFIADTNAKFNAIDETVDEAINESLAEAKASGEFDGEKGEPGEKGDAGVSPTVDVSSITGGHRVTITDAQGTETFDVMNGADGNTIVVIASGTDFDTLLTPNKYVSSVNAGDGTTSNYVNCPIVANTSFSLEVIPTKATGGNVMQRLTTCSKGNSRKFERHYHSGSWGEWFCTYADRNTVLWSGEEQMDANTTITLSEPISRQPAGVVLVFAITGEGHHYSTHFVSKYSVATLAGKGHTFAMFRNYFAVAAMKYLYISDTSIKGNGGNVSSGTGATGIVYDSSKFSLVAVIGV